MRIEDVRIAYFIGIGGIGMSAIARYFKAIGIEVHGYDKTKTHLSEELEKEGMVLHYTEDLNAIPEKIKENDNASIVVYTPAIPSAHAEIMWLKNNGNILHKRAEVLGIISRNSFTIGVAGTHGKTTTSTMVAHLLNEAGVSFTAFLGGISTNFGSNYVHVTSGKQLQKKPLVVVEADEFDRSFLQLSPDISIVTSTDPDHLDIYGKAEEVKNSFQDFVNRTEEDGIAIIKEGLDLKFKGRILRYGKEDSSDVFYDDVKIKKDKYLFGFNSNIRGAERAGNIVSGIPGFHNIENATAAITACLEIGINIGVLAKGTATFKGVKRRFEYVYNSPSHIVIDDYAHHPEELRACIESVKHLYPEKKLTGIFQPHLFSRTRDFADGFARSLDMLDECWLMPIYPARELPIEGVSSEMIAGKMEKDAVVLNAENIYEKLKTEKPELLLILGAGDIDNIVEPVKLLYEKTT
ncbi:MAG: UDP-N-acetylmuramate--L-alanine ligase [Bacteroidia bacterium]|nr:UDP-N-acetylmuramate--L-alanine ligase [Bacteroidia bacterium]